MIDFTILTEHIVTIVLLACLILGYIIKHSIYEIPNKYIPVVLVVFGAGLNILVNGACIESVVYGAFTGLASIGLHQSFKNLIEKRED